MYIKKKETLISAGTVSIETRFNSTSWQKASLQGVRLASLDPRSKRHACNGANKTAGLQRSKETLGTENCQVHSMYKAN